MPTQRCSVLSSTAFNQKNASTATANPARRGSVCEAVASERRRTHSRARVNSTSAWVISSGLTNGTYVRGAEGLDTQKFVPRLQKPRYRANPAVASTKYACRWVWNGQRTLCTARGSIARKATGTTAHAMIDQ